MKTMPKPTQREFDVIRDKIYKESIEALQMESAMGIIATARFFGLGKRRLERYLNFLVEVKHEYNIHYKDGVIAEMLKRDLETLKVSPDCVFEEIESIKKMQYEIKQMHKHSTTSMKEAAEITAKMKQFEEYMRGKK